MYKLVLKIQRCNKLLNYPKIWHTISRYFCSIFFQWTISEIFTVWNFHDTRYLITNQLLSVPNMCQKYSKVQSKLLQFQTWKKLSDFIHTYTTLAITCLYSLADDVGCFRCYCVRRRCRRSWRRRWYSHNGNGLRHAHHRRRTLKQWYISRSRQIWRSCLTPRIGWRSRLTPRKGWHTAKQREVEFAHIHTGGRLRHLRRRRWHLPRSRGLQTQPAYIYIIKCYNLNYIYIQVFLYILFNIIK